MDPLPPYPLSSHWMASLTAFRNLHGTEDNWPPVDVPRQDPIPRLFYLKAAVAEVGFGWVALTATVEMVAYGVFMLLSMLVWPLSKKPAHFFNVLFHDSVEAQVWAINYLCRNLTTYNLPTQILVTETRAWLLENNRLRQAAAQLAEQRNQLA